MIGSWLAELEAGAGGGIEGDGCLKDGPGLVVTSAVGEGVRPSEQHADQGGGWIAESNWRGLKINSPSPWRHGHEGGEERGRL